MKTAEQRLEDDYCLVRSKSRLSGRIDAEGIREIQLDAFKAGMTKAASVSCALMGSERNEGVNYLRRAILTARDNKTTL